MNILVFGLSIFALSLLVIELSFYAARIIQHPDRTTVRKRLKRSIVDENFNSDENIYKNKVYSDIPVVNRLLMYLPGTDRLNQMIYQANLKYTLAFFLSFSMTLGLAGYLAALTVAINGWLSFLTGAVLSSLPAFYVRMKRNKRMGKFEKQLPEALDLIARALRAGHAFTSGMKLASEEFDDPLGPEIEETLDEINFGMSVSDALKNLVQRVDCSDLRFFVVSVILQRETGGNLAEIMEGLAHLIRERFKFRGKVRVLSAEGRLSGTILIILPFVTFAALYLSNKSFAEPLIVHPMGRSMLGIGAIMLFLGALLIRKIIKIDV